MTIIICSLILLSFVNPALEARPRRTPPPTMVRLTLPQIKTQDDDWSCGVNSATRVLKYYGHDVSYDQLRTTRKKKFSIPLLNRLPFANRSVPLYRFGTRPGGVQDILEKYLKRSRVQSEVDLTRIFQILRMKKPIIVLIRPKDQVRKLPLGKSITLPRLHWIVVSGFDSSQRLIYYYDTTGNDERTYSFDQFLARWNWDHKLLKTGLRFRPRTLVY